MTLWQFKTPFEGLFCDAKGENKIENLHTDRSIVPVVSIMGGVGNG